MLSNTQIETLFEYKADKFYNRVSRGSVKAGTLAGYNANDGYRRVCIQKKYYYIHRLIWQLLVGEIEDGLFIDHIDGDRLNNSISNLRLATARENQQNKFRQKVGTSAYKGVWWDAKKNVWKASFRTAEKRIYLGQFESELEAAGTYDEMAKVHHGEFAKLNL